MEMQSTYIPLWLQSLATNLPPTTIDTLEDCERALKLIFIATSARRLERLGWSLDAFILDSIPLQYHQDTNRALEWLGEILLDFYMVVQTKKQQNDAKMEVGVEMEEQGEIGVGMKDYKGNAPNEIFLNLEEDEDIYNLVI